MLLSDFIIFLIDLSEFDHFLFVWIDGLIIFVLCLFERDIGVLVVLCGLDGQGLFIEIDVFLELVG